MNENRQFLIGAARGLAGALIFALPMLMTQEMWAIGAAFNPLRLAVLTGAMLPVLYGLSYFVGLEDTPHRVDDMLHACAAYGIGFVTAAVVLSAIAVVAPDAAIESMVGMVALQAVPASIGALLAQTQFGDQELEEKHTKRRAGYGGELFFMAVGALFLAFSLAPTEEMLLIAQKMTPLHAVFTFGLSLVIMHAFVYGVHFAGMPKEPPGTHWWTLFARHSVPGYAIALLVAAFLLWALGRTPGLAVEQLVSAIVVLGVPASIGAAAARLIF